MKKTGLVIAATAAALFVAGCATQAETSAPQPAPVSQPANACKGMSSCKAVAKKYHKKRHHAAAQQQQADTATTTTTTQSN